MKRAAIIAGALVLVVGAIVWWLATRDEPDRRLWTSGTVEATEAQVGFPGGGRLDSIVVREGQAVARGEELARLDREQVEAERRQAEAELMAARAILSELETGSRPEEVASAQASLRAARARFEQAQREFEITNRLFRTGTVTRAELNRDRLAMDTAATEVTRAEQQLELVRKGPREEAIAAQRARVLQAEARVATLDAVLAQMVLEAPFAGIVTVTHRQPGEIVAPGTAVVTIMDPEDRWVRTYVPLDRIGAIDLGAAATIRSDTFPDREYPGEVTFIASEAEFTPKQVQTEEERLKLVYAVTVRVLEDPALELKPGMPVDVVTVTRAVSAKEPVAKGERR
jgi:HlyD family secretion protein